MDFKLNDEQLEFQQKVRRFSREVIRPIAPRARPGRERPVGGHQGRPRVGAPRARDDPAGWARTPTGSCRASTPRRCTGAAPASRWPSRAARSPRRASPAPARPEQIGRWVPECFGMGDEIKLGAYAVTEPSAGSDVRSLRTTAKQDGDEWILNGTKVFITNGGIADVTVVVATVDPDLGHRGQASFVVPKDTPGLSQGKKESKLGHPRLADHRGHPRGLPGADGSPARRLREASEEARARPLRRLHGPLLERARHLRAHAPARGRLGARHRAGRVRVDARVLRRQGGGRPAAPQAAADPADAGRRGHRDRGRAPARVARRLDGSQRHPDDRGPGLDVEAEGGRRRRCGRQPL